MAGVFVNQVLLDPCFVYFLATCGCTSKMADCCCCYGERVIELGPYCLSTVVVVYTTKYPTTVSACCCRLYSQIQIQYFVNRPLHFRIGVVCVCVNVK